MNKFNDLYEALVSEVDWRKLANVAPGKAISGAGKITTTAGSLAGKATGMLGYALGTGGKALPGTQALQAGIQKGAAAVGGTAQKAGAAIAGYAAGAVDKARQAQSDKIAKQLGISSKVSPKSGETVSITLGKFAGQGLGITSQKAALLKPVAYEGGMLYTVPLKGVSAAGKNIDTIKVLYNPSKQGAADIFYFDKSSLPIQNAEELGLPGTAILKPNPDKQISGWILSDRKTSEPVELNTNARQIRGQRIDVNAVFKYTDQGGKIIQFKALTAPDATGNFVAIQI